MKTANTAVTTMIVALVAMIGMAGFAMAGSTTANYVGDGSYNMDFDGMGTGSMDINTWTSTGFDHMGAGWTDTNVSGHQDMYVDSYSDDSCPWTETDITRDVTVGAGYTNDDASGYIQTYTTDGGDNSVSSMATYHDDVAGGSNVHTYQYAETRVDNCEECEDSGVYAETAIDGFAYGADTLVTGTVGAQSGNMSTLAVMKMTEGGFNLGMGAWAFEGDCWDAAGAEVGLEGGDESDGFTMTGTGTGNATIAGGAANPAMADFYLDATDDGIGYHADGNAENFTAVNFHDEFDDGYTGTGHIYVYNMTD